MYTGPAYDDFLPNGLLCSNVPDVAGRQLGFLYPYFINIPFNHLFHVKDIDFRYINSRLALEDKNCLFLFSVFFKDVSDYMRFLEKNWRQLADDIEKGVISDFARPTPETRKKLEKVLRPKPERAEEIRREFEKGFDETIIHRLWPNMSVISGIGMLLFETPRWSDITAAGIPILYAGVMSGAVGYTLQMAGQKYTDPALASLIMPRSTIISALS
jgi:hypothetical protein